MHFRPLALIASALFVVGCESGQVFQTSKMVGCYAKESGGAAIIKIAEDSGRHRFALREEGHWEVQSESLRAGRNDELDDYFGADTTIVVESLLDPEGAGGLFRLKKGATFEDKPLTTEYVVFLVLAGSPVYRVACP
jgi:hypothetical protein